MTIMTEDEIIAELETKILALEAECCPLYERYKELLLLYPDDPLPDDDEMIELENRIANISFKMKDHRDKLKALRPDRAAALLAWINMDYLKRRWSHDA